MADGRLRVSASSRLSRLTVQAPTPMGVASNPAWCAVRAWLRVSRLFQPSERDSPDTWLQVIVYASDRAGAVLLKSPWFARATGIEPRIRRGAWLPVALSGRLSPCGLQRS